MGTSVGNLLRRYVQINRWEQNTINSHTLPNI